MSDDTLIGGAEEEAAPNLLDDAGNEPATPEAPTPETPDSPGDGKGEELWEAGDIGLPDGFEEMDEDALGMFIPVAKQLNLSKEQAQQVINVHAEVMHKAGEFIEQETQAMFKEWANESMKDSEIGGAKLQQNVAYAKTAIDQFGTSELKELLNATGLGNNPEMIRLLSKVGEAVSNDRFIQGKSTDGQPTDPAKILFPDMG